MDWEERQEKSVSKNLKAKPRKRREANLSEAETQREGMSDVKDATQRKGLAWAIPFAAA
jgi:hypothetical protein